ncbi:MAG: carboxypeptidase-like regulatory domain-containing protein [Candidatus Scalinduaceae bacterium]
MLSKSKYVFMTLLASGLIFCLSNISSAYYEEPARVTVQVIALGAPIHDAEVSVGDESETTGHNGNYVFQVNKGVYTVSCTGPHGGSGSQEIIVNPGEIIQVTFELGAEGLHAGEGH